MAKKDQKRNRQFTQTEKNSLHLLRKRRCISPKSRESPPPWKRRNSEDLEGPSTLAINRPLLQTKTFKV